MYLIRLLIIVSFLLNCLGPVPMAQAQELVLPKPGVMIHLSSEFTPAYLEGLIVHPDNGLQFDFLIHKGDEAMSESQRKEEYNKLIKYFLASLTTPDEDQWVNLSPYEKDRIIKEDFGKTEMGRDLLAQDYILKEITASLIYPEGKLGKKFWDKVYAMAQQQFGTTNIPVNTFNKVWIMPDEAVVYESGQSAVVLKSHLKVMLEQDYLSLDKHAGIASVPQKDKTANQLGSAIVRDIVLPELQKEVNEGKNFAPLRQVYSAMILATWYKKSLKESLLGKIYADRGKVKGIDQDSKANEVIYQQYLKAFKKGVYNYIKEDFDQYSRQTIPRRYFSGGIVNTLSAPAGATRIQPALKIVDAKTVSWSMLHDFAMKANSGRLDQVTVNLAENKVSDRAMMSFFEADRMVRDDHDLAMLSSVERARDRIRTLLSGPVNMNDFFEFNEKGEYRALRKNELGYPLLNGRVIRELARRWIENNDDRARRILFSAGRDSLGMDMVYKAVHAIQSSRNRQDSDQRLLDSANRILSEVEQKRDIANPLTITQKDIEELVNLLTRIDSGGFRMGSLYTLFDNRRMYELTQKERRAEFKKELESLFLYEEHHQQMIRFYESLERLNFYRMPMVIRDLIRLPTSENSFYKNIIKNEYSSVTVTLILVMEELLDYYDQSEQKEQAMEFVRQMLKRIDRDIIFESQKAGNKLFYIFPSAEEWLAFSMFGFYPGQNENVTQLMEKNPGLDSRHLPGRENLFMRRIMALSAISPAASALMMGANGMHLRAYVPEEVRIDRNGLKELDYPSQIVLLPSVLRGIDETDDPVQKSDFTNALLNGLVFESKYYKDNLKKILDIASQRSGQDIRLRVRKIFQEQKAFQRFSSMNGGNNVMGSLEVLSLMSFRKAMSFSELLRGKDVSVVKAYVNEWRSDKRENIGDFEYAKRYEDLDQMISYHVSQLRKELEMPADQAMANHAKAVQTMDVQPKAVQKEDDVGGIDLNSANLNLQIKRNGRGVALPVSQQDLSHIHIEGLIPVIIDIKPVMDLPILSELSSAAAASSET